MPNMAHQDIEIEIKLPLQNSLEVKSYLDAHAKVHSRDIYQKDIYYTPAHKDFLAVKYPYEWLRLRQTNQGCSVNYKHFHPENAEITDFCDEYETKVDNLETMRKIFTGLGIKELVTVEKTRTTWHIEHIEIVIDEVTDLGTYIELEATTGFEKARDGKNLLYAALQTIGAKTGPEDYRGYPYLLLAKKTQS